MYFLIYFFIFFGHWRNERSSSFSKREMKLTREEDRKPSQAPPLSRFLSDSSWEACAPLMPYVGPTLTLPPWGPPQLLTHIPHSLLGCPYLPL